MAWLVDTNVLLRIAQPNHSLRETALASVNALLHRGERVCVVPQNLTEFWSVATRPVGPANGLGLSVAEAKAEVVRLTSVFELLPETAAVFPMWLRLVSDHEISGIRVYDARLVASMKVNEIENLLTFDAGDFRPFTDIRVLSPLAAPHSPPPAPM